MQKAKKTLTTKQLTLCAMFTAVVTVATIAIAIPVPGTGGYINLGDGIILAVAYLCGGYYAAIAGGLGSALADLFAGYAQWVPFTFVIKGAMGYVAARLMRPAEKPYKPRSLLAALVAELIMVGGYYLAGIVFTSPLISLESVPPNCVQAVGGIAVYLVLAAALGRTRTWAIR